MNQASLSRAGVARYTNRIRQREIFTRFSQPLGLLTYLCSYRDAIYGVRSRTLGEEGSLK
jgi:hypothetical protein